MSYQSNIGSVTDKQKFEDKCDLYSSSKIDSGFISGELPSEEFADSGVIEEKKKVDSIIDSGVIDEEEDSLQGDQTKSTPMLVDSGVCLIENFSKISLKQGHNNFDAPSKAPLVDSTSSLSCNFKSHQPAKGVSTDIPWEIYYDQNEDGDT